MVVAVLLGMVSMTFIYKYLGQGALAEDVQVAISNEENPNIKYLDTTSKKEVPEVMGVEDIKDGDVKSHIKEVFEKLEDAEQDEFENRIIEMVK